MKISKSLSIKLAKKYNINLDVVDIDDWHYGLNVELEHGTKLGKITNVTNNNIELTSRITLSHLIESPRYYRFLRKLEDREDKYWSTRNKPNIFN